MLVQPNNIGLFSNPTRIQHARHVSKLNSMWVFLSSFREYCSPENTNNLGRNNGCQEPGSSIADKTTSWQSWPWFRGTKWLSVIGRQWGCHPKDRQDSNPLIPCSAQSIWETGCRNKKHCWNFWLKARIKLDVMSVCKHNVFLFYRGRG